jgi:hypothetical protein
MRKAAFPIVAACLVALAAVTLAGAGGPAAAPDRSARATAGSASTDGGSRIARWLPARALEYLVWLGRLPVGFDRDRAPDQLRVIDGPDPTTRPKPGGEGDDPRETGITLESQSNGSGSGGGR